MSEQHDLMEEMNDDPFEQALRELHNTPPSNNPEASGTSSPKTAVPDETGKARASVKDEKAVLDKLGVNSAEASKKNIDLLLDIEIEVYMEIGKSTMLMSDLLLLGQSSVIELDRLVGDDLDLVIGKKKIGKAEVVITQEKFAARIKQIFSHKERLRAINS